MDNGQKQNTIGQITQAYEGQDISLYADDSGLFHESDAAGTQSVGTWSITDLSPAWNSTISSLIPSSMAAFLHLSTQPVLSSKDFNTRSDTVTGMHDTYHPTGHVQVPGA